MSIDISKTFIRKLATQGEIFSKETFRTLKATYLRTALDYIEIYKKDSIINNIRYDEHTEEKAVEVFSENIMKAGGRSMWTGAPDPNRDQERLLITHPAFSKLGT